MSQITESSLNSIRLERFWLHEPLHWCAKAGAALLFPMPSPLETSSCAANTVFADILDPPM